MTDDSALNDLRTFCSQGRLLPFVGAGVSTSVEWTTAGGEQRRGPSWKELVDQAAILVGSPDPNLLRVRGEDLQILEYFRSKNDDRLAKLTNWLVQRLDVDENTLLSNPIFDALASMGTCKIFYTTNFDDFLERSLKLHGRVVSVVASEPDVARALAQATVSNGASCEVVKFHGDLDHPDMMVVSESQYRDRLALTTPMDDRLKSDILGRLVLFLGYSFRDWNVSYLFHLVNSLHGGLADSMSQRRAYITVAAPSDFERTLFEKRGIGVIPIPSGSGMTQAVTELLRNITPRAN